MDIRGMFEFNCACCGEYKIITAKGLYKYKIKSKYFCSYSCFERYKYKREEKELSI